MKRLALVFLAVFPVLSFAADYKLLKTPFIRRTRDNADIPFNPDNADYQEFLKWLNDGNIPDPQDPDLPHERSLNVILEESLIELKGIKENTKKP